MSSRNLARALSLGVVAALLATTPVAAQEIPTVAVALDRPALQPDALALAEQLATTPVNKGALTTQWLPTARRLLGLAKGWDDPSAGDRTHRAAPPELTQWLAVSRPTAESRGAGVLCSSGGAPRAARSRVLKTSRCMKMLGRSSV